MTAVAAAVVPGGRLLGQRVRRDATINSSWTIQICASAIVCAVILTSCATLSRHQFAEPARNWEARSGQLLYRAPRMTLIGEVLVRFSKEGNFELTLSKGPGVTLLQLRQDMKFAEIKGPLVHGNWSGPVEQAPKRLRGWLTLREPLLRSLDRPSVRHVAGTETFLFRF
jgi:hypothetical protein